MEVSTAIQELVNALTTTKEFEALMQAKQAVMKDQKMFSLVAAFNKKRENLYMSENLTPAQTQAIMSELEADYKKLSTVPEIKQYFDKMEAFGKLMDSTMNQLQTAVRKLTGG